MVTQKSFQQTSLKRRVFKELKDSWWVGIFCLFTCMLYLQTSRNKIEEIEKLKTNLEVLKVEKREAQKIYSQLKEQIGSQNDPYFVEMVLIKKLGVVPEGGMRVQFKRSSCELNRLNEF